MKNFGKVLATTAIIAFAAVNAADDKVAAVNATDDKAEATKEPDFFDTLQDVSFYSRRVWLGLY